MRRTVDHYPVPRTGSFEFRKPLVSTEKNEDFEFRFGTDHELHYAMQSVG
jgi:hypothetical protein